jgi:glycosyltransferase involved in cell wall biosynthesis
MVLENLKTKYGHKKIMLTSSDNTGCGYHRIYSPYMFLKDSFEWCEYNSGFPANDKRIFEADVIVIQRALHEYFLDWIPHMQANGKKIIYDLDDTLWDIPASNLAHNHYPPKELKRVEKVMKLVDCITTSTVPLGDFLRKKFNKPTFIVPNKLWMNELSFDGKIENERLKIGWAGSYTHKGDFGHYLADVLRNLPHDKVDLYMMGYTPTFAKSFATSIPWAETKDFHKTFAQQNWDIGIMVAKDNMFNRCKSNLKFLEYGSTKCAPVGHAVYPYSTTITHGVDGLLVENEKKDWGEYLYKLIEDDTLRKTIANNAYENVKTNWTYEGDSKNIEAKYMEIFDFLAI